MKKWIGLLLALTLLVSPVAVPVASATVLLSEGAHAMGDINADLQVNASDALMTLQNAVGKRAFSAAETVGADVNGDKIINATDALYILRYSVNKIAALPAGDVYDAYTVPDTAVPDPTDTYAPYAAGDFGYDTSLSYNGAYANDTTADCSFVMDNTGLAANTVYVFTNAVNADLDVTRLVYSLQGLINRDFGRDSDHTALLYARMDESDRSWLEYMQREGAFLETYQTVSIATWDAFWNTFANQIRYCGLIAWDGNVPATANVAATICGLDGYLPVLSKSPLYYELMGKGVELKQSLVNLFENGAKGQPIAGTDLPSTGSAKNDAYRWAMEKYFDRCSANYLAYILDGAPTVRDYQAYDDNPTALLKDRGSHCLSNHDYLIARRCFFFDLHPYKLEAACDDPAQVAMMPLTCPNEHKHLYDLDSLLGEDDPICPTCGTEFLVDWETAHLESQADEGVDNETMLMLFDRRYQRAGGAMGQLMGFPPWWLKYTEHSGQGRQSAPWIEWLFTEYITCYNLAKEADAAQPSAMTNGSAYYKYVPLLAEYDNRREAYDPGVTYRDDTLYYTLYVGDYDSSAWMKLRVYEMWMKRGGDRFRGKLPITWCYNPNLSYRIPMAFDYIYENKKENEFFAAGDSGAGYIIPAGLFGGNTLTYSVDTRPASYADGDTAWATYCQAFYRRFDMTATGFIINGSNPMTTQMMGLFNTFSTSGALHNCGNALMTQYKGVPYVYCQNGINGSTDPSTLYSHAYNRMEGYNFSAYRTVCVTPTDMNKIVVNFNEYAEGKGKKVQYVELYTFLDLAKASGQGYVVR